VRTSIEAAPPGPRSLAGPQRCSAALWLVSILIVAFFCLKVAEGWLGIESWPLTNVSMFYWRQPPEVVPKRARLFGVRGAATFEMTASDFWLSEDEFNTRLRDEDDLSQACGALVQSYNRRMLRRGRPQDRLTAAHALREELARPGVPREPWRIEAECDVTPSDGAP
jgi:hypothetical protein